MENNETFLSILDTISEALHVSRSYGLTNEVVATMFVLARKNPKWTVDEVMIKAMQEWDI